MKLKKLKNLKEGKANSLANYTSSGWYLPTPIHVVSAFGFNFFTFFKFFNF